MKKLLLAIAILSPLSAVAEDSHDVQLRIGGWSNHLGGDGFCSENGCKDWNETNNALGVRVGNIEVATMTNSYYERSYLLGYHFSNNIELSNSFDVELGVWVGAATGYSDYVDCAVCDVAMPFVQPYVTAWFYNVGAEIGLLPGELIGDENVLSFAFKYRF